MMPCVTESRKFTGVISARMVAGLHRTDQCDQFTTSFASIRLRRVQSFRRIIPVCSARSWRWECTAKFYYADNGRRLFCQIATLRDMTSIERWTLRNDFTNIVIDIPSTAVSAPPESDLQPLKISEDWLASNHVQIKYWWLEIDFVELRHALHRWGKSCSREAKTRWHNDHLRSWT